jgi:REP element-mobilizing transposase RayT
MPPTALCTLANCNFAYQLRWGVTVFWKKPAFSDDWLATLRTATTPDGVRILRHRFIGPDCSQFLISTRPPTKPSTIIWSIKGRLQNLIRDERPLALQRNYDVRSVGSTKLDKIESYVARQLQHHAIDQDQRTSDFRDLQFVDPEIDLSQPGFTAHGRHSCNLHIVFVLSRSESGIDQTGWVTVRDMIRKASAAKEHRLSRLGIVPDHLHMTLGVHPDDAPAEVALSYMNNIGFALGMRPVLMHSCYIGGVEAYDLGSVKSR